MICVASDRVTEFSRRADASIRKMVKVIGGSPLGELAVCQTQNGYCNFERNMDI